MKKGYHSTQRKYFNTVPRTAFLGFVLGYGIGLFVSGLFHTGQTPHWVIAVIGAGIGYWIDGKYFAEKDLTPEEIEAEIAAQEAAERAAAGEDGEIPAIETVEIDSEHEDESDETEDTAEE